MLYKDHPDNILGVNNANNLYNSSLVAANADGSMIERQEYMQGLIGALTAGTAIVKGTANAGTNSTTEIPITSLAGFTNDFFNDHFYMQVLVNANSAGNAPESQVRKITDYVSSTGTFTCDAFSAAVEASDLVLILHESQVAIGRNDADNVYDSSTVAANAAGSVLERLEALKDAVDAVDNYVDAEITAIKAVTDVIPDAGALTTISGKIDAIDNYVDGANLEKLSSAADGGTHSYPDSVVQDSMLAYIMSKADPAVITSFDNATDSLEAISDKITAVDDYIDTEIATLGTKIDAVDDLIDGANLEKLTSAADGGTHAYPDAVAQESVIAYILSKSANPVTTSYDNQTDSLEAISDKIDTVDDLIDNAALEKLTGAADGEDVYPAAVANDSVIAKIISKANPAASSSYDNTTDSLEALSDKITTIDDFLDGAALEKLTGAADGGTHQYPDAVVQESVIAYILSKSADPVTTSYDNQTDSLEAISDKITAVDDYVDTEVTALQTSIDAFAAAGGDGKAVVRKTVTFSNTDADVNLFTITAGVNFKLYAFCTTNCESAGTCTIGVDLGATAIIADTAATDLEANDIWHDAAPDASVELKSVHEEYTAYGGTIVLDVEAAHQVDSGVIEFVCIYSPLSATGAIAAA